MPCTLDISLQVSSCNILSNNILYYNFLSYNISSYAILSRAREELWQAKPVIITEWWNNRYCTLLYRLHLQNFIGIRKKYKMWKKCWVYVVGYIMLRWRYYFVRSKSTEGTYYNYWMNCFIGCIILLNLLFYWMSYFSGYLTLVVILL